MPHAECHSTIHYVRAGIVRFMSPRSIWLTPGRRENRLDFSWYFSAEVALHRNGANLLIAAGRESRGVIIVFCFDRTSIVSVELQSETRCIHQWPGFTCLEKREPRTPTANEQYGGMSASITWALLRVHPSGFSSHLLSISSLFSQTYATRDSASTSCQK